MCNQRHCFALALLGVVLLSRSIASAEPKAEAKEDRPSIGEVRTQKLKEFTYFYGAARVSLLTFPFKIGAIVTDLHKAMDSVHARPTGPMILMFRGALEDATADYDVEIGFPVADKTPGVKDFKVRQAPEYECMSVLYSGPLGGIVSAYETLIPTAEDNTGKPASETRVMFLYVEGAASANNVLHVSVGVKP